MGVKRHHPQTRGQASSTAEIAARHLALAPGCMAEPGPQHPVHAHGTYFSRRFCSSFLMSASSGSESLSLLM